MLTGAVLCAASHSFLARRVLDIAPEQTTAVVNENSSELVATGNSFYEKGDNDAAIAAYAKAIRLDPMTVSAYVSRAECYEAKGDFDMP